MMSLDYVSHFLFILSLFFIAWSVLFKRLYKTKSTKRKEINRTFSNSDFANLGKLLAVIGSGGHTREILCLVPTLPCSPRYYVAAEKDTLSREKILSSERERNGGSTLPEDFQIDTIPRSREVKQSYMTSVYTTCKAMMASFPLIYRLKPDVVLCNGPGTCIPICFAALVLKFLKVHKTHLVYVESWCRVKKLSLSGLLLYPVAYFGQIDFFVQWPELAQKYPRTIYKGGLVK